MCAYVDAAEAATLAATVAASVSAGTFISPSVSTEMIGSTLTITEMQVVTPLFVADV